MRPSYIVIHHSATPDGRTFDAEAIRRFHTSWRDGGEIVTHEEAAALKAKGVTVTPPWKDTGYHFLVELVDGRPQGIVGRPLTMSGAHCIGRNNDSLGVCVIGNYDRIEPDAEVLDYLVSHVLKPLMETFNIPRERILFHREMEVKTCPGKRFTKQMILSRL
jgi:hypothetical protein